MKTFLKIIGWIIYIRLIHHLLNDIYDLNLLKSLFYGVGAIAIYQFFHLGRDMDRLTNYLK